MSPDFGVQPFEVILFTLGIVLGFAFLIGVFYVGYWVTLKPPCPSPYTGLPLRPCHYLSYILRQKIVDYLTNLQQYDNQPFDLDRAAFCRETGRIFPNAITWYEMIKVDWTFLQKRFPGQFVSWGSLDKDKQEFIRHQHHSLDGFQTEFSSPSPSPIHIEEEYAYAKPGPLYVDLSTYVLLGWKEVPDTELEVLIVQRPKGRFEPRRTPIQKKLP